MMKPINPQIECHDGFTISVQGSSFNYSLPREDDPHTPYTHVECGYPSSTPLTKRLRKYAERLAGYTDTVYGYVPIEVVESELDSHGGIRKGKLPQ